MGSTYASTARGYSPRCFPALSSNQLKPSCGALRRHTPKQLTSLPRRRTVAPITAIATEKSASGKSDVPKKASEEKTGAAKVTPELAKELYADMYLGREFEERCAEMYYRGKMFGFVHLYSGQEAVSTGVISCLTDDDYVCSTYRDHVHALSKGVPATEIMAELFGKQTAQLRKEPYVGALAMSFSSGQLGGFAFIGEGIPIGVGAAFQTKYRKEVLQEESATHVTCSFFGDGTCNNGQFYECLNMAGLYNLPHIFVVENNLWAIGMQHNRATSTTMGDHVPYIYKKGPAFGFPGVHVDGMDVLKVREVTMEAVERARNGGGPTLIECETYRYRGHSLADPDELRSKKEKDLYMARDPLPKFKKAMLAAGILKQTDFDELEKQARETVDEAIEFAEKSPKPEQAQLLENVFADPKGFGVAEDGRYRFELPGFTSGNVQIS